MLDDKDRNKIIKAIDKLAKILEDLDVTPSDPRALDLIEIVISLLEMQVQGNISFMKEEDVANEMAEAQENVEAVPSQLHFVEEIEEGAEPVDYDTSGFKFLEDVSDIPSPDELKKWFDMN